MKESTNKNNKSKGNYVKKKNIKRVSKSYGRNRRNSSRKAAPVKDRKFRVIPLGGMKEIGKNMTLIEYENEILIVDCGFSFPADEMFGIDVVIPDFSYLKENMEKIKGLVITHGHEDHIGGIPFLLQEINVPIYGSPLSLGLIEHKLEEHSLSAKMHVMNAGDVLRVGSFSIEAIRTNHSIADSYAFSIKCPAGHVLHTGDFKVDFSPLDGKRIDLHRFARLGEEGVDVMLCDSTNVLRPGYTPSERIVVDSMNRIFEKTDKRIIIATFSSNIYRIKYFMEASINHGRKIAISGRSMEYVLGLARELGYLDLPESAFVDIRRIGNIPDGNLTIVTTGSQGEPMSALTRMVNDSHKAVKLKKGDVVVFSSSPIPGNEKTITNVVNKLYEKGVNVYLSDFVDIHVSGHACQEELKIIHSLVKPRYFIPAHGEYRHLMEHARLAESLGMSRSNIFVMSNGDSLLVEEKRATLEPGYASGEGVLVDGYGVGDVVEVVLRDRKQLSEAGLVVIALCIDRATGELMAKPELITRGFIYVKENGPLIDEATDVVMETLGNLSPRALRDVAAIKTAVRDAMRTYIYKKTKRSPVILPVILYV
ncbi:MAG: ribonuclease J [Mogibacterium sp.]|nr:ribonuclease J [Mogibacterium sp.]